MKIEESDWHILLTRLRAGTCTPFLGAAVNHGILPLGADIARNWANRFDYPLDSKGDLAKVAQYLAIKYDHTHPKELIRLELANAQKPFDFNNDDEPLNVLAKLPLPVYITPEFRRPLSATKKQQWQATNRKPRH